MLEKVTFTTDDEVNKFFRQNPGIYIVKFIVTGGKQHIIYTKDKQLRGKDHMQKYHEPEPT